MHSPSAMTWRAASYASAMLAGSSPVQSNRRNPMSPADSAASLGLGSPGTAVLVTGQSCQSWCLAALGAQGSPGTPDAGDETRPSGQVAMITYAGKRAMLDEYLLRGFPLHISMLNTEQTRRSEQ